MRGRELGLHGQDLMLYQMGEVVQIGVSIEKDLQSWIADSYLDLNIPKDFREIPVPLAAKVKLAQKLAKNLPFYSDEEKSWLQEAFADTLEAMKVRNRVVHDHWVSFGDGKVTRFGYFAARDGFPAVEVHPGQGPGEYSHEEWEDLRTLLWHCHLRLFRLTFVRRRPPDFGYFFGDTDAHYAIVRGEFYVGRDYLVPWSWSKLTQAEVDALEAEAKANGDTG